MDHDFRIGQSHVFAFRVCAQQENICEYPEKGIYTIDVFSKQNATLTKEIKEMQIAEANLLQQQKTGVNRKRLYPA